MLIDLDELTLTCRDARARSYITEAVACYRAGAYRSAIVAAWIAVCYDIIDKLRELSLAGDKVAEHLTADIERARANHNMTLALKLERQLLEDARDKFELLSHLEYVDLVRLREDRNRCAHPSLVSEDQAFQPPGELARLHIRNAVSHLLQHPPAQGKYALERLIREVDSPYFPNARQQAVQSFSAGPLARPRASLVRNFVIVLLKRILDPAVSWQQRYKLFAAVGAVRELHPAMCEAALSEKLSSLIRPLHDDDLKLVVDLLRGIDDCWGKFSADVQNRIASFVRALPASALEDLEFLIDYAPLEREARSRLGRATRDELRGTIWFVLPPLVGDRYVDIYVKSDSFASANDWAQEIIRHASDFSADQQRRLIAEGAQNSQVTGSFQIANVVASLRGTNRVPPEEFEQLVRDGGVALS